VLLLAERLLERGCRDYGLPAKCLAPDARARLLAHPWPGNVRELSNVIERAALIAEEPLVTGAMLAFPHQGHVPATVGPEPAREPPGAAPADHLRAALAETGWNISRAAARLGIARNTLRARMDRVGLGPGRPAGRPPGAPPPGAAEPSAPPDPAAPRPAPAPGIRWERRSVTLLRVSLVPTGDDTPAEAARALPALLDKVRTFGGRIEDLGRAGFDASFGVEAAEAAPELAAHAALAVLKAAERARRLGDESAGVKLALHTEPCLVGVMGGALQIDQQCKRRMAAVLEALLMGAPSHAAMVSRAAGALLERRFALRPTAAGDLALEAHTARGLGP
jgi:hypothetical protein